MTALHSGWPALRARIVAVVPNGRRAWLPALRASIGLLRMIFLAFTVLLALGAWIASHSWYATEPRSEPAWGANFSCKRVQFFGQDCRATLASVLDDLGVRSLRLSVHWSDVEGAPGEYDWSAIDWQLREIGERGGRATVSIGMKAQRFPEFWLPTWLRLQAQIPADDFPEDHPLVQQYLFPYLQAAAQHLAADPVVEAIQVENEPFVHYQGHANGWRIRKEFLAREIATVRAGTGGAEPIVVNHASWLRRDGTWKWAVRNADVLAQSVYTKRQRGPWKWLYIFPYRIGPFTPDLPEQARAARRDGKQLWIAELQAEPYERPDVDVRRIPAWEARSFSPRWLERNLDLARRSGATRVYLWGVEWWAYLRDQRGDPRLWQEGQTLFHSTGAKNSSGR